MKTLLSICSARPNFVKLAAIHHALKEHQGQVKHVIVHTGQHFDPLFSDIFFEQLEIPLPDINLGIHGGTHEEVIVKTKAAMVAELSVLKPDIVLVYGDVNGAVGGAQAAHNAGIPVAHIEAGLRSFDQEMPEERNRIAIDAIADWLFVSEESGMKNLEKEQCKGRAFLVGNTMIDTLVRMIPAIERETLPISVPQKLAVATLHRPSNVDSRESLLASLTFLSEISGIIPVILPLHHRTKAAIETFGLQDAIASSLKIIDPLGYIPFLALVHQSTFILTDSGGIQEEATFLRKKCFTLRKNTERPATVESGSNTLIDLSKADDRKAVLVYADHPKAPFIKVPELWDGRAGERILSSLL